MYMRFEGRALGDWKVNIGDLKHGRYVLVLAVEKVLGHVCPRSSVPNSAWFIFLRIRCMEENKILSGMRKALLQCIRPDI